MEIKKRNYGLRIATTEAAFARNAEFGPKPFRSFNPRTRPGDTIGEMNKPKIEFGRGRQSQLLQRFEICFVRSAPRNWHVNPLHWSDYCGRLWRSPTRPKGQDPGLQQMLVPRISIAQMKSEIDVGRDRVSEIDDPSKQAPPSTGRRKSRVANLPRRGLRGKRPIVSPALDGGSIAGSPRVRSSSLRYTAFQPEPAIPAR